MRRRPGRCGVTALAALGLLVLAGCRPAIPDGTWRPTVALPATSHVYLESQPGDPMGGGRSETDTEATGTLNVYYDAGAVGVIVGGTTHWNGLFRAPRTGADLMNGYYPDARTWPPYTGSPGLVWNRPDRACASVTGWFAIDRFVLDGGALRELDLRFEQHCDGATAALHGRILVTAPDPGTPPGPRTPPPGLWVPAPGSTPATGNYAYFESEPGDHPGDGRTTIFTQANAAIAFPETPGELQVNLHGDEYWEAFFRPMAPLTRLEPGYYGNLARDVGAPAAGGLNVSGNGRGCNSVAGWFVVDHISYAGATPSELDLRLEQHCEGAAPALHGQIHWRAGDPTAPPGQTTPPPGLWAPAPGATPASGTYVFLQSEAGDPVGGGLTYTYTPAVAALSVSADGTVLTTTVSGGQHWSGSFAAMAGRPRIEAGYYGGLQQYPYHNPARGGLAWSGAGRACATAAGWFAVDQIRYSGPALAAVDLRFEYRCTDGTSTGALHGKVHWQG